MPVSANLVDELAFGGLKHFSQVIRIEGAGHAFGFMRQPVSCDGQSCRSSFKYHSVNSLAEDSGAVYGPGW